MSRAPSPAVDGAGGALLGRVIGLATPATRRQAASELARLLGGHELIVFTRDDEVGVLLPAPGFPQTLPGGRAWREFVTQCSTAGEAGSPALVPPGGGEPVAAYGISCGADVVAVILGTSDVDDQATVFRDLLPLLAATFRAEAIASRAIAQARVAQQAAGHAEALATTLDRTRVQLQQALAEAESARTELEAANDVLQGQATELEAQADELQRANLDAAAARDSAQEANQAKTDFLATMSHELRTPLNAIGGYSQLIALGIHGPVTEAQRDALARIDRSHRHLLGIINDILNLSRIEAGRIEYALEDVSLSEVLHDVRAMIEPQLAAKGLAFVTPAVETPDTVRADREKLQQILLNLLSNAVKFTERGGSVTLECARREGDAGRIAVTVTDTGIGIAPEKLERIFEPFVQVDASHVRQSQGVGLGLAISRDLALGMGCELFAESAPAGGSTFTLLIPAV